MDFLQLALSNLNDSQAEAVGALFNRLGYGGAVSESSPPDFSAMTVRTIIPHDDETRLLDIEIGLALLAKSLPGGLPHPTRTIIGETDWAQSWKTHFHVVKIPPRVVIQPSWRDYTPAPDDVVVHLDPGLAFGSGLHQTTRLCLTILQGMNLQGVDIFDVGTGSGILSITAAKLGANPIRAVDNDPIAVDVTRENLDRNQISTVQTTVGSAADTGGRRWSLVVANILAHILIEIMADLKASLATGGQLILSGLINEQTEDVTTAAMAHGLKVINSFEDDGWTALVVTHQD